MTPPEESNQDWAAADPVAWGEIEYSGIGDAIHAGVDFAVLLVVVASGIGLAVSALGFW